MAREFWCWAWRTKSGRRRYHNHRALTSRAPPCERCAVSYTDPYVPRYDRPTVSAIGRRHGSTFRCGCVVILTDHDESRTIVWFTKRVSSWMPATQRRGFRRPRGIVRLLKVVNIVGARPNFVKRRPHRRHAPTSDHRAEPGSPPATYDAVTVKALLRRARDPRARRQTRGGLGLARRPNCRGDEGPRARSETLKPDVVLVVGDVNSTLAAALTAGQARHPRRPTRRQVTELRSHDARRAQSVC